MANIKFSQFTVGNTESDIDFVVGYKGANNIQISPANLLSATLTGYLPLTGGTMSGNIVFTDNVNAIFGNANDLKIFHDGSGSKVENYTGNLTIQQRADDSDIVFQCDDGSGGITDYFRLDGSTTSMRASKNITFIDGIRSTFGSGADLFIYHNGTTNNIEAVNGKLRLIQTEDDGDISFESDDGSGGITEYFRLDGGNVNMITSVNNVFVDNKQAAFGDSADLRLQHSSGNNSSYIQNYTGDLYIENLADDKDIIFKSDDGSGGIATYFLLDGSSSTAFNQYTVWPDNSVIAIGTGKDLQLYHNGSTSYIYNNTGNLDIFNAANDADIRFFNDDGSGGVTEYFKVDGSDTNVRFSKDIKLSDGVLAMFGSNNDLLIYHDGTDSRIYNNAGDFVIRNQQDDGDIKFQSDNGSGGTTTYLWLDGTNKRVKATEVLTIQNSSSLRIGDAESGQLYVESGNTVLKQVNSGNISIRNEADDSDIIFSCDDGSGGVTTYFFLDGSTVTTVASKQFKFEDNVKLFFGTGADSAIYASSDNLIIEQTTDDKDIIFRSDDGSGGTAEYLKISGSAESIITSKSNFFGDNVKAIFGAGSDLQIYHDGNNSYIDEVGTGSLYIKSAGAIRLQSDTGENMIYAVNDGAVNLYHNNVNKLATTSTGIKITGVSQYADNTAAIAGGLTAGDVYRTGDLLKIVH